MSKKSIYNMELHEKIVIERPEGSRHNYLIVSVVRVAGGWLYEYIFWSCGIPERAEVVFVPFHNKFMEQTNE